MNDLHTHTHTHTQHTHIHAHTTHAHTTHTHTHTHTTHTHTQAEELDKVFCGHVDLMGWEWVNYFNFNGTIKNLTFVTFSVWCVCV